MVDLGLIYINRIINDWPNIMDFEDTEVTSTASLCCCLLESPHNIRFVLQNYLHSFHEIQG